MLFSLISAYKSVVSTTDFRSLREESLIQFILNIWWNPYKCSDFSGLFADFYTVYCEICEILNIHNICNICNICNISFVSLSLVCVQVDSFHTSGVRERDLNWYFGICICLLWNNCTIYLFHSSHCTSQFGNWIL